MNLVAVKPFDYIQSVFSQSILPFLPPHSARNIGVFQVKTNTSISRLLIANLHIMLRVILVSVTKILD